MRKLLSFFLLVAALASCDSGSSSKNSSSSESSTSKKCSDMGSYDFGYSVARDQQGLAADCDYLYDIAKTQRNISSKSCFCQGVSDFRSNK